MPGARAGAGRCDHPGAPLPGGRWHPHLWHGPHAAGGAGRNTRGEDGDGAPGQGSRRGARDPRSRGGCAWGRAAAGPVRCPAGLCPCPCPPPRRSAPLPPAPGAPAPLFIARAPAADPAADGWAQLPGTAVPPGALLGVHAAGGGSLLATPSCRGRRVPLEPPHERDEQGAAACPRCVRGLIAVGRRESPAPAPFLCPRLRQPEVLLPLHIPPQCWGLGGAQPREWGLGQDERGPAGCRRTGGVWGGACDSRGSACGGRAPPHGNVPWAPLHSRPHFHGARLPHPGLALPKEGWGGRGSPAKAGGWEGSAAPHPSPVHPSAPHCEHPHTPLRPIASPCTPLFPTPSPAPHCSLCTPQHPPAPCCPHRCPPCTHSRPVAPSAAPAPLAPGTARGQEQPGAAVPGGGRGSVSPCWCPAGCRDSPGACAVCRGGRGGSFPAGAGGS